MLTEKKYNEAAILRQIHDYTCTVDDLDEDFGSLPGSWTTPDGDGRVELTANGIQALRKRSLTG